MASLVVGRRSSTGQSDHHEDSGKDRSPKAGSFGEASR